jgi:hypothetical protein
VTRRRQFVLMLVAGRDRARRVRQNRMQKAIERRLATVQVKLSGIDRAIDEAIRQSSAWQGRMTRSFSLDAGGYLPSMPRINPFQKDSRSVGSLESTFSQNGNPPMNVNKP